jgi:hypothetical protein
VLLILLRVWSPDRYVVVGGVESAFVCGLCCCGAWRQFVVMVQVNVEKHRKLQLLSTLQVHKLVYLNLL